MGIRFVCRYPPGRVPWLYALLLLPGTLAAQTGSVEIWMRAFIPDAAGRAVKMSVRNQDGECYATDHRGFSTDPSTTARLETRFNLIPLGQSRAMVRPESQRTSMASTTQVDCNTLADLRSEMGRVEKDHIGTPALRDG